MAENENLKVLDVAFQAGRSVLMKAKGDPASTIACAIAAAIVVGSVTVGYGSWSVGKKIVGILAGDEERR